MFAALRFRRTGECTFDGNGPVDSQCRLNHFGKGQDRLIASPNGKTLTGAFDILRVCVELAGSGADQDVAQISCRLDGRIADHEGYA